MPLGLFTEQGDDVSERTRGFESDAEDEDRAVTVTAVVIVRKLDYGCYI